MTNSSAFLHALSAAFGPPGERRQHDRVDRASGTIADAADAIGYPWRAESLLERLERRGDIGHRERRGGEEFSRLFHLAHLDPLRAADMLRSAPGIAGSSGAEDARRRVMASLDALGGQDSLCGSAAWFILGNELSVRQWAMRRALRHDQATGILRGTLGVLASHFGT